MTRPPYEVPSTQYFVLILASAAFIGCYSTTSDVTIAEPSLAEQLAVVKTGQADEILVSAAPASDDQLAETAEATALRVLLIDHADSRITAAGVKHLIGLPNLEHLRLRGARIDDAALGEIAKIAGLKILNIPRGEFSNAGLEQLKALPNLVQLRFGSPHVTDDGMLTLAELPALTRLHLIDVPITDVGLRILAGIEQLESLYIDGAELSEGAYDELFRQRPGLHVHLNQQHHDRDPHRHAH